MAPTSTCVLASSSVYLLPQRVRRQTTGFQKVHRLAADTKAARLKSKIEARVDARPRRVVHQNKSTEICAPQGRLDQTVPTRTCLHRRPSRRPAMCGVQPSLVARQWQAVGDFLEWQPLPSWTSHSSAVMCGFRPSLVVCWQHAVGGFLEQQPMPSWGHRKFVAGQSLAARGTACRLDLGRARPPQPAATTRRSHHPVCPPARARVRRRRCWDRHERRGPPF